MHSSFNSSHIDSLSHPTEHEYETYDENNHDSRILYDKNVSVAKVTQLSGLKNEIEWSHNSG
jgi:hypothetical protein